MTSTAALGAPFGGFRRLFAEVRAESVARIEAARALLVGLLLLASGLAVGAAERPVDGVIVQAPTAITSESTNRLRSLLYGPLKRFEAGAAHQGGKFVLICDFNPDGRRALCDDFGASYSLADYLRSLPRDIKGVRTVAYVHGTVKRHSVLPVLACSEIVFSEKARLGQVSSGGKPLPLVERTAYEEISRNRYPPALVRKMYEANLEVVHTGDRYAAADEKPRPRGEVVPELSAPEPLLYTFPLARKVGLCQSLAAATLEEARVTYGLPRANLNRSLDRTVCWRIPVEGAITGEVVEQTKRRIGRALRARANLLILELKCSGGDGEKAYELGLYLATLNEKRNDNPVETIAYVTNKARNLAVFLAFGCNKIAMQLEEADEKDPEDEDGLPREARLGGFDHYLRRHTSLKPILQELSDLDNRKADPRRKADLQAKLAHAEAELAANLRENLIDLAGRQMYPAVLAAGMLNPELRIYRVERAKGASGQAFLSQADFDADQKGERQWRSLGLVQPWQGLAKYAHRPLTLTARQAQQLGLAHAVVKDLGELYEVEGVSPRQVRTPEADWLDGLADFLRDPWTSVVLVMLGVTCLILELKMPGVGLPGVIAAICFVLFFWSHSQLNGQITWLAILLFVLGLILIGLEVFVLPGFGVAGISGALLVLASLGLVAYGHWPRSSEEWITFGNKLAPFSVSLLGSLMTVFVVVKYLPHIPILNRLMLRQAEENEDGLAQPEIPMHAELQALLGAIGIAATPLRPAGKTQFGDSFIDVVAEGGYIMPGTRVQVVEVEGNRVVVKEV
jgi:membrane-bound ClpP family serine protease